MIVKQSSTIELLVLSYSICYSANIIRLKYNKVYRNLFLLNSWGKLLGFPARNENCWCWYSSEIHALQQEGDQMNWIPCGRNDQRRYRIWNSLNKNHTTLHACQWSLKPIRAEFCRHRGASHLPQPEERGCCAWLVKQATLLPLGFNVMWHCDALQQRQQSETFLTRMHHVNTEQSCLVSNEPISHWWQWLNRYSTPTYTS